jgi:hypothetical protein
MLKVKHFICGASYASLDYFDEDMNKWMAANNIQSIKNVHEFYGQAPVGMSGHQENVIFVSVWYEEGAPAPVASKAAAETSPEPVAS